MFRKDDWVVFKEDHQGRGWAGGTKGYIVKLASPLGERLCYRNTDGNSYLIDPEDADRLLKLADIRTRWIVIWFERDRGAAENSPLRGPYTIVCEDIEEYRREIRDFEDAPEIYEIVAKKKVVIPFENPNDNLPEIEEPVADDARVAPNPLPEVNWGQMDWNIQAHPPIINQEAFDRAFGVQRGNR